MNYFVKRSDQDLTMLRSDLTMLWSDVTWSEVTEYGETTISFNIESDGGTICPPIWPELQFLRASVSLIIGTVLRESATAWAHKPRTEGLHFPARCDVVCVVRWILGENLFYLFR